ncbi:hypothetical protein Clacol_008930 [Clathrus columnatus]|uniref:Uncharacterized protein n=1 Tax=Clathrus columnatus TaxID=1419009 RepID=A0AAV5APP5_9AGAM|nr:hypothetical protein Clacol_008930 [Clathrus columnatus]
MSQKLPRDARRIQTIIVALPVAVVSGFVLYKRIFWGEEQRKLRPLDEDGGRRPLLGIKTVSWAQDRDKDVAGPGVDQPIDDTESKM